MVPTGHPDVATARRNRVGRTLTPRLITELLTTPRGPVARERPSAPSPCRRRNCGAGSDDAVPLDSPTATGRTSTRPSSPNAARPAPASAWNARSCTASGPRATAGYVGPPFESGHCDRPVRPAFADVAVVLLLCVRYARAVGRTGRASPRMARKVLVPADRRIEDERWCS